MVGNAVQCLGNGIIDSSGGIVKFNGQSSGGGIDEYFDPVTHTATEENFIRFLEAGIYTTDVIGYKVVLSNSVDYNNGTWVITDVNHDSTNTGQTNCYDLISENCFYNTNYNNRHYRNSNVRTWLINTFYPGFSTNIKNHTINIVYNSRGTWYNDDKITVPSFTEVNGSTGTGYPSFAENEGLSYPIFTDSASRDKYEFGTTTSRIWWTRSCYDQDRDPWNPTNMLWYVSIGGNLYALNGYTYNDRARIVPLLRVS